MLQNAARKIDLAGDSKDAVRKILDLVKADKRTSLTAPEGKLVCDAYGIPVPKEGVAKSASEAAKIATGMGFPVVMKIVSPDILHKTEAGGVMVGVKTSADVHDANRLGYRRAYCRVVMLRSAPRRPANKNSPDLLLATFK